MFETQWGHYWFLDFGCILCQTLFCFVFLAGGLVFCFLYFGKLCRTAGIGDKSRSLYLTYVFSETVA